jgi:hypothetical protein
MILNFLLKLALHQTFDEGPDAIFRSQPNDFLKV